MTFRDIFWWIWCKKKVVSILDMISFKVPVISFQYVFESTHFKCFALMAFFYRWEWQQSYGNDIQIGAHIHIVQHQYNLIINANRIMVIFCHVFDHRWCHQFFLSIHDLYIVQWRFFPPGIHHTYYMAHRAILVLVNLFLSICYFKRFRRTNAFAAQHSHTLDNHQFQYKFWASKLMAARIRATAVVSSFFSIKFHRQQKVIMKYIFIE